MDKVIIQVAMNERVSKSENPHVPITPEEIAADAIACWRAGASIVHFHPRDARTGANLPRDVPLYLEALGRIRAQTDAIFYPTAGHSDNLDAELAHVRELAVAPGRVAEMYLAGIGAWSMAAWNAAEGVFTGDSSYVVGHNAMLPFLRHSLAHGMKVVMMAHELGHVRSILMLQDAALLGSKAVVQLNFSDGRAYGPLPDATGIRAYLGMFPAAMPLAWFVQTPGRAHHAMNALAIAMGGHPRIGIGDGAPESRPLTNAQLVERTVAQARAAGREVASPAEAREMMGMAAIT